MIDARRRQLLVDVLGGEALGALGDQEALDALVGCGPHDGDVGDRPVGDPHLLAVQDPVITVAARAGAHRAGVRARVGLGQAEAADRLAGGHARQPLLLLLLAAPAPDRVHGQRALDRDQRADAGVAGLELQAGQAVGGGRGARAAVAGEVHAQDPQLAQRRRELGRPGPAPPRTSRRPRARSDRRRTRARCRGCRAPRRRGGGRCPGSPWGGSRAGRRRCSQQGSLRTNIRRSNI